MITDRQKLILTYNVSKATFLGIGCSLIIDKTRQDSVLASLLGILIGMFIIYIYSKILDYKKDKTLNEFLKELKWKGKILRVLMIFFSGYIIFQVVGTLQIFKTSFFLVYSPNYFITIPVLILIIYIVSKGIKTIAKVAESLFFFEIILVFLIALSLSFYFDLDNFFPTLMANYSSLTHSAFTFGVLSSVPTMFLLNLKNDGKNILKMYYFNCFILILIILVVMGVFGPTISDMYRFPEYMILKRIKIFSFIEKVENFLTIIWLFDIFFLASLAAYTIKSLITIKYKNSLFGIFILIIFYLDTFIIGKDYSFGLFFYYNSRYIYGLSFLVLIIPLYLETFKKKKDSS